MGVDRQGMLFPEPQRSPSPAQLSKTRDIPHLCLWPFCGAEVKHRFDVCDPHWRRLPIRMRAVVAVAYQDGKPLSDEEAAVIRKWCREFGGEV